MRVRKSKMLIAFLFKKFIRFMYILILESINFTALVWEVTPTHIDIWAI